MIDWQILGERLTAPTHGGTGTWQAAARPGGDISRAFRLESGQRRFFVKLNRAELLPMFIAEQAGLDALARSRTIRVPAVAMTGTVDACAFIAMEYIDLDGRPADEDFASQLAALHRCGQRQFGFEADNYIGETVQANGFEDDWVEFWRRRRLGFQLELARQKGFDSGLLDAGFRLADKLDLFFTGYRPRPSLLHGDLWAGNQGADAEGNPVIYDPACYYGDHEADLAMMELFGSPGARFFAAYNEHFVIDSGYAQRRELYNLYHLLNHALLFGGSYVAQSRNSLDRLLACL